MRLSHFLLAVSLHLAAVDATAQTPPIAEQRTHALSEHGIEWVDPYFWLRDREDPAVRAYLEAENDYTEAHLGPLKPLRDQLVAEMKARIVDEDLSVPFRRGDWLYYTRTEAGADFELICRKPHPDGDEQILLDLNHRAGDSLAYSFGAAAASPDGRLYAWKENHDGTDRYTIRVKDLETGELLPDEVPDAIFWSAPVWTLDGRHLYYTTGDDTDRSWRVMRHELGTPAENDLVIYQEDDARFQVWAGATKSQRFLLIGSASKDTSEVSVLPLDQVDAEPRVFSPRRDGIRYQLTDCDDQWFILTNDGAINSRLLRTSIDTPESSNWIEVLPGDDRIAYDGVDAFASHVVIEARREGVPGMFLLTPDGGEPRWVTAPLEGAWFGLQTTPEYSSATQRIAYESFLQPEVIADVDLATGEQTILKQKTVPGGFDPAKYRVERSFATATDGERIPIWLLLPADHPMDGSGAILMTGYGAYGSPSDPFFHRNGFSLIDRGVGYAIAQIRGGGEFGRAWYEAGKLADKQNTFSDFIACADHLIAEGYTSADQLCGYGGSAGGLLAGAVVNQAPDRFRAFVADVPFVDALNTMLDPSIPLTTSEYDEWGNPSATLEEFERIRAYSPYDNVAAQDYPALFALAGWNDNRVPYWEAAKWIARLRATATGDRLILLSTEFEAGHGGASGRYRSLEETALTYAFLLQELGRAGE